MLWLGRQAWMADDWSNWKEDNGETLRLIASPHPNASWGHLAERLLPMLGLFGTAFGLSLQAKALSGGATSFEALATSLYCTACGVLAALIVAVATYSLEAGIRRAGR